VGGAFQRPLTIKLPLPLTSFAPGSTAQERRAGNFINVSRHAGEERKSR